MTNLTTESLKGVRIYNTPQLALYLGLQRAFYMENIGFIDYFFRSLQC